MGQACPGEVKNLLLSIKQNAAMGPDKISVIVLKKCSASLSNSLATLFTLSLITGELPHEWKGKLKMWRQFTRMGTKHVKNYRPIRSVTSLVGKALEKHVRTKTADFLNQQKAFPDNQHGFRTGRSCTTMLLEKMYFACIRGGRAVMQNGRPAARGRLVRR
jgi:hypothetical protein